MEGQNHAKGMEGKKESYERNEGKKATEGKKGGKLWKERRVEIRNVMKGTKEGKLWKERRKVSGGRKDGRTVVEGKKGGTLYGRKKVRKVMKNKEWYGWTPSPVRVWPNSWYAW